MTIKFPKKGGVKITGDREELEGLMETIKAASEDGRCEGSLLTADGIETVVVICTNGGEE